MKTKQIIKLTSRNYIQHLHLGPFLLATVDGAGVDTSRPEQFTNEVIVKSKVKVWQLSEYKEMMIPM